MSIRDTGPETRKGLFPLILVLPIMSITALLFECSSNEVNSATLAMAPCIRIASQVFAQLYDQRSTR